MGEQERIKDVLRKNPKGMTIEEVSKKLSLNRATAAKYLNSLVMAGQADMRTLGPAKLFYLNQRLPLNNLLSLTSDLILILDSDLFIQDVNEPFLDYFRVSREDIKGEKIEYSVISQYFTAEHRDALEKALEGNEFSSELFFDIQGNKRYFLMKGIPLVFEEGGKGVGIILGDITGIKEYQHNLEVQVNERTLEVVRAKNFAENLILTANTMIVGLDCGGNISIFNKAAEEITGYRAEEVMGKNWFETIVPKETYPEVWEEYTRPSSGNPANCYVPRDFENPLLTKSGEERLIRWSNNTVHDDGAVTGIISFGLDITDRKRSEDALRIQRDLNLQLNRCMDINDAINNILSAALQIEGLDAGGIYLADPVTGGLELKAHKGLSPQFIEHTSHYDADAQQVQVSKTGQVRYGKYISLRPDTEAVTDKEGLRAVATMPVTHEGNLIAVMNLASHTIDEIPQYARQTLETLALQIGNTLTRIRTRQVLKESEERFRTLIEKAPVAISISRGGRVVYHNPALLRMFGYPEHEDLVDKPIVNNFAEHCREDIANYIHQRSIGLQTPLDYETKGLKQDGSEFPVHVVVALVHLAEGDASIAFLTDITDRKMAEEAIKKTNKQILLLNSITRHDILNQLAKLSGYVGIVKNLRGGYADGDLIKKEEQAIETIRRQIVFTRDYQNIGTQPPAWINVKKVISNVLSTLDPDGIRVVVDVGNTQVFTDLLIEKVFFNLVENSQLHGEKVTTIRIWSCRQDGDLILVFEDDGIGIAPEEKELIFTRGYGKNTGYGLFLVREILSITGFTIEEKGIAGKGARFEITVPGGQFRPDPENT